MIDTVLVALEIESSAVLPGTTPLQTAAFEITGQNYRIVRGDTQTDLAFGRSPGFLNMWILAEKILCLGIIFPFSLS